MSSTVSSMSSSQRYSIVEPHPSVVAAQSYMHSGRGGAGNSFKAPSSVTRGSDASGPAARASLLSLSKPRLSSFTGRGGAGNAHDGERAMFSFDEELERQMVAEKHRAPVYHVGRGGAGNLHKHSYTSTTIRRDSDANSASSTSSVESGADIATRKLKESLKKITKRSF